MYLHLRVTPSAKRASVKKQGSSFLVSVCEKAERNLANKAALAAMASHLKLPLSKVRLVSGHRSPSKIISIND